MKRYLSDQNIERVKNDFGFLIRAINRSFGELDLRLRGVYFNLYYKGNSLAKVTFTEKGYEVSIHWKFAKDVYDNDDRFKVSKRSGEYVIFKINDPAQLPAFFQKKYLDNLCSAIKKTNYGEEIMFEQMLITDNRDRRDLIIIDRQITETSLRNKRLDLLGLKEVESGRYGFLVIEVKLGNNKELKGDVVKQLHGYIEHIKRNFDDWKKCYKRVYDQMRYLNLIDKGPSMMEIKKNIKGMILVGRYSGLASDNIKRLQANNPGLTMRRLVNRL